MTMPHHTFFVPSLLLLAASLPAADALLPFERTAYYTSEPIEIAVVGLSKAATATVEIIPQAAGRSGLVAWTVTGDGGTVNAVVPPFSLAPGKYVIKVDGQKPLPLTVSSGVVPSTMLVSQTSTTAPAGGANFHLTNAFDFGRLDAAGMPMADSRGQMSIGLKRFDDLVASDLPSICYMYWTGYVTHKPFGGEKSWANADMQQAMRLLNFSVAQRFRRFAPLWHAVGPIDEPGLSWGKTPAGGMASGFPNWDEQPWYETRGWKYTQDVGSNSPAEWQKYLQIRCSIIKESYAQAAADLKTVMPGLTFAGDLYALHAMMDGCDGLNQQVNDIPTSHVFFDWFGGPMAVPGQFHLETCHAPGTKLAHAMNGQLEGVAGPQKPLYHWLMNGMLQGGMHSNWWLNTAGMSNDDLTAVNEPVARFGPLFQEMELREHDVAILWGFSELSARQHEMAKREATKKNGEQIKLLLPLPDKSKDQQAEEVESSAYEVGGVYANQILGLHQTMRRAGYPAVILHEEILATALTNCKVLCLVDQTAPLSAGATAAIAAFVKAGGIVLVDRSTTLAIPGARVMDLDLGASVLRSRGLKEMRAVKEAGANKQEASRQTVNLHRDDLWRAAVTPVKAALRAAGLKPILVTESRDLSIERHVGGEGALIMVLNGTEALPVNLAPDAQYPRYNPASATHTYTLQGIPAASHVWAIEGLDWKQVVKLDHPAAAITAEFAAGEMKLYVVAPRIPSGISTAAKIENGVLVVTSSLDGVQMPWPLTVTVTAPDGKQCYVVNRAFGKDGRYTDRFPLGLNAQAGDYNIQVAGLVGGFSATAKATLAPVTVAPSIVAGAVRIMDQPAIRTLLAAKPALVIALGNDEQKPIAEKLAAALNAKGISVSIRPVAEVVRKAAYPRVLNPFAQVFSVGGAVTAPGGEATRMITLDAGFTGVVREPGTLATVGAGGWMDWSGDQEIAYEAGVQLYVNAKNEIHVLNATSSAVPTDLSFRARWCKPWTRLSSHHGGYQLAAALPEAFSTDSHLILLGDNASSPIVAGLQASEIFPLVVDGKYPGPGKAVVQYAWSPFAVGKDVIYVGAGDAAGLQAGAAALADLLH